jgi:O-antigen ligase
MGVSVSLQDGAKNYINSKGPWYLAAGSVLGLSGLWVKAPWPAACLLIVYGILLGAIAIHFFRVSKDKDRYLIACGTGIASVVVCILGALRISQYNAFSETASRLRNAGIEMFLDRPQWGWGLNGFEKLLPFYADDQLLPTRYESSHSDLIQLLAEFGILGLAPVLLLIVGLLIRYIRGAHEFHLTNYLLFGCLSLLVLACLDNPFQSPTVFFSFWIILFSALRWADLSRNKIDEVDARVIVVSSEDDRRVPVYEGPYDDQEK